MLRAKRFAVTAVFVCLSLALTVISPVHPEPQLVTIITEDGIIKINTTETVVADVLAKAEIALDSQYEMTSPALDEELDIPYIVIKRAVDVTVRVDGEEYELITWAGTVEDLLQEQNIVIDGDLISAPLEQTLITGMTIDIVRVDRELVSEGMAIVAKTTYKRDSNLDLGKEKVQTKAKDGKKLLTYEVIYHDGIEVARNLVTEEVIDPPIDGIVLKGTRATVSRSGNTSGVVEGIASYYGSELHGRRTASGVPFDMYAFTAAHRTLPFKTRVRVTFLNTGKSVVVEINDRGPFVAGRIIDLSAAAAKEIGLYPYGIGKVKVEVLD